MFGLLVACGSYFPPDRHVTRTIANSEIIGTWKLASDSLSLLQRDGFAAKPENKYTITFNSNGSLNFASVLEDFESGQYVKATGTWTLKHNTSVDSNIKQANALIVELQTSDGRQVRHLNFTEDDGTLRLWSTYGDPDSWEFMEYEKVDRQ